MRDYGKVHTSYWSSQSIRGMSEDGRTLAMYLLTCQHGTISGVFRLPDGYACEDLQWTSERVKEGFAELLKNGFANRCETTKWVWITKHFEWNPPENPNQKKSARKIADQVPDDCAWKPDFMRVCGHFFGFVEPQNCNPSETLPKPFLNQEQEQEQEQESKPSAPASPDADIGCQKKSAVQFKTFFAECRIKGEKPIPEDDSVFDWAEKAGVPDDFLRLAWLEFRDRYANSTKRYRDWRMVFRNAVRDNWYGIWFCDEQGQMVLTSKGRTIQQTMKEAA